jgi:hypothetical protein
MEIFSMELLLQAMRLRTFDLADPSLPPGNGQIDRFHFRDLQHVQQCRGRVIAGQVIRFPPHNVDPQAARGGQRHPSG